MTQEKSPLDRIAADISTLKERIDFLARDVTEIKDRLGWLDGSVRVDYVSIDRNGKKNIGDKVGHCPECGSDLAYTETNAGEMAECHVCDWTNFLDYKK